MSNFDDKKENLNSTFSNTTKSLRRNSILKMVENESKFIDEQQLEETTKIRKSRRVSFSANIQVKTIDDELQPKHNDSITELNTQANSKTRILSKTDLKKLNDTSSSEINKSLDKTQTIRTTELELQTSKTQQLEYSMLPLNLDNTILDFKIAEISIHTNEKTILVSQPMNTGYENENDYIMDDQDSELDKTSELSVLPLASRPENDSILEKSIDSPEPIVVPVTPISRQNVTYELIDSIGTNKSRLTSQELGQDENETKTCINETINIEEKTCNNLIEPSIYNKTYDLSIPQTPAINQTFDLKKNVELEAESGSESFYASSRKQINNISLANRSNLNNLSIQQTPAINQTFDLKKNVEPEAEQESESFYASSRKQINNISLANRSNLNNLSILNETSFDEKNKNIKNQLELLNDKLMTTFNKFKNIHSKLVEEVKVKKEKLESSRLKNEQKSNEIQDLKNKIKTLRSDLDKKKMNAALDPKLRTVFIFKQEESDKIESDLKSLTQKNKNNDKEFKDAKRNLDNLKDKVENNFDKIKSLQADRNEKEKLKKLYKKLFNDENIPFRLAYYDNDTIILLFFYGFIQLEIKATNLVHDLSSKSAFTSDDSNELCSDLCKHFKYLNYPLQQLNLKSNIDSYGNHVSTPLNRAFSQSASNTLGSDLFLKSSKKVSMFVRYCISLILGEFGEENILNNSNKYKYVRDLPMLMAHLNLACNRASNLVQDFEYFAYKTFKTCIKCDFDINNYIVSIKLPSIEDGCMYNLRLKVKPGSYYQEPITFEIDQKDLDEPFEPNYEKIKKLLEDQYFENGSLKDYFKKLQIL